MNLSSNEQTIILTSGIVVTGQIIDSPSEKNVIHVKVNKPYVKREYVNNKFTLSDKVMFCGLHAPVYVSDKFNLRQMRSYTIATIMKSTIRETNFL